MSDNQIENQMQPEKKQEQPSVPKWSVKIFGRYVPLWLVVVVVAVVLWLLWDSFGKHSAHKQSGDKQQVKLQSETGAALDRLVVSSSPNSAAPESGTATVRLSTPDTDEVRKQLNKLFSSF
jgi:flagellar biosynthesis/type III secretory pathway M-ring protein FliF/YscJ